MARTQATPFETSLAQLFGALADRAPMDVDAVTLAASTVRTRRGAMRAPTFFGRALTPVLPWLVLLSLLIVLAAVAAGSLRSQTTSVPLELLGSWVMDRPDGLGFGAPSGPSETTLFLPRSGQQAFLTDTATAQAHFLYSTVRADGTDELVFETFATVVANGQHQAGDAVSVDGTWLRGCFKGDTGHYHWSLSGEQKLTLTALTDDCPSRMAAFEQMWTRVDLPRGTP